MDLCFSYYQYSSQSYIDGDFALIVLGAPPYDQVLHDPFGIAALHGESYPAPNRFTAHAFMSFYFKSVPFLLQTVLTPLNSLFTTIAITKLFIHLGLLFLISYYVSSWKGFSWYLFLLAAVLITPFFQAGPVYYEYMAIIDGSITYVMFYALPMVLLLVYFLPFYWYFRNGLISGNPLFIIIWLFFTFFLVLFGPLPGPIILLFGFTLLGFLFIRNFFTAYDDDPVARLKKALQRINKTILILLAGSLIFSSYSIFIGTKNIENTWSPMPLEERYSKFFEGMKEACLNFDNGLFYLLIVLFVQALALFIFYRRKHYLFFKLGFFIMVFGALYLILLPMGGYRFYRPLVVKHDTLLPFLVIILFLFITSGFILFSHFKRTGRAIYIVLITIFLGFYTFNDKPWPNTNECEKHTILKIAQTNEECIMLPRNCTVAMWNFNAKCEESELAATLFEYYNIFPRKIHYRFEPEN